MTPRIRTVAFVLFAGLVLAATGCGASNNKGKIAGKWQITGGTDMKAEDIKMMEALKFTPYIEFREDGTGAFGVTSADPEMLKMLEQGGEKTAFPFKYKLNSGDEVELFDLPKELAEKKGGSPFGKKDRAKSNVKITGDNMTIVDDDKKELKLTKMK
jgi:hypothetical protein